MEGERREKNPPSQSDFKGQNLSLQGEIKNEMLQNPLGPSIQLKKHWKEDEWYSGDLQVICHTKYYVAQWFLFIYL